MSSARYGKISGWGGELHSDISDGYEKLDERMMLSHLEEIK